MKAIVEADPARRIVVSSAAGKRSPDDHKLTDLLYLCHAHLKYGVSCDDIMDGIEARFKGIRDELGIEYDVEAAFRALRARLTKDMSVDELVSRGEYFTSRLLADYLGYAFVDATDCVFFGFDGQVDREKSYAAIAKPWRAWPRRHSGILRPVTDGKIRVMSRGGSDITGALAAAAAGADVYENWTDVSGILMADPKIVKDPKPISRITYGELRELAFMGASVLHEESVQPVKEKKGIALNIRNTNAPADPGTMIVDRVERESGEEERFITGIAGRRNTIISVFKHNMNTSETLRRTLEILDRYKASVEHITLGLDSFALVSSTAALGDAVYDVINEIQKSCRPDDVRYKDDISLVAAVGRKNAVQAGRVGQDIQGAGRRGDKHPHHRTGADEPSIIVGVENRDFEKGDTRPV